jgi:hypothetical protein
MVKKSFDAPEETRSLHKGKRRGRWTWVVPPASEADQKCFKLALFEMSGLAGSAPSMDGFLRRAGRRRDAAPHRMSAALTKIFRQQIPALRDAIQELSQGRTESGFDKLDQFGAIQEIEDDGARLDAICQKHLEAVREKRTSLIVAPTHGECRQIAKAVRATLRKEGGLSPFEQM